MSEPTQTFWKVTAFTTTSEGKLLILEHPTAGRQVPAGSVEPEESLEDAARREVLEESGLDLPGPMTLLGVLENTLAPTKGVMSKTSPVFRDPKLQEATGASIRRGITVLTEEHREHVVKVRHEEFDYSFTPPKLERSTDGWIRRENVADKMSRALFLVPFVGERQERWTQTADGHVFSFLWVDLAPRPSLIAGQQEWLDAVYEQLIRMFPQR